MSIARDLRDVMWRESNVVVWKEGEEKKKNGCDT